MIDLALKGTYIARDRCNDLFLYKKQPFRSENVWADEVVVDLKLFKDVFKFIKWEDTEPFKYIVSLGNRKVWRRFAYKGK